MASKRNGTRCYVTLGSWNPGSGPPKSRSPIGDMTTRSTPGFSRGDLGEAVFVAGGEVSCASVQSVLRVPTAIGDGHVLNGARQNALNHLLTDPQTAMQNHGNTVIIASPGKGGRFLNDVFTGFRDHHHRQ